MVAPLSPQCLNSFKLALREQSLDTPLQEEPASVEPESPDQAVGCSSRG